MSEKDIKILKEIARQKLKKGITKAEAIRSLQNAGILTKQGKFAAPYRNLGRAIAAKKS